MGMQTCFLRGLAVGLVMVGVAGCNGSGTVGASGGSTASAGGAQLASGEYDCSRAVAGGGIMPMGKMDIKGGQYRFRSLNTVTDGFTPYSLADDGTLTWGGKMGGLDTPPSVLVWSKKLDWGFRVRFRVSPTDYVEDMDCRQLH